MPNLYSTLDRLAGPDFLLLLWQPLLGKPLKIITIMGAAGFAIADFAYDRLDVSPYSLNLISLKIE